MYCKYCGAQMEDGAQFCEKCGAPVVQENTTNNAGYNNGQSYQQTTYNQGGYNQGGYNQSGYNQNGFNQTGFNPNGFNQYQQPYRVSSEVESQMTRLLILSVLQMICCNQIFGGIGLVFAIIAKTALSSGDFAKYEKNSRIAKYVLIAGVILGLLCGVFYAGVTFLDM